MPNYCTNIVTVSHADPEQIARIKAAVDRDELFQEINPCPQELVETVAGLGMDMTEQYAANLAKYGHESWYSWCLANWGTKWEATDIDVSFSDENEISCSFMTAWAPPIPVYEALVAKGFNIVATYREEGMGFMGAFTNEKGDQCISY